jgi:lipopolysaccharide transport system ATP-binding protein
MTIAIRVENLSKRYILRHQRQERYTALRDVIATGAKRFTNKLAHPFAAPVNDPMHEEFWALRDVSFNIQQGDRIGIIGRNGAGKSTLLKILSRITEPTRGKASIRGRVASLLEVGTGFHPELTGRENIFLNGAILGMSKAEIKKKFDEIVAFAEVEKFLDTPVKRYSSGMYVRLAFAVAAHLEPEILIVDEVLAVGDAAFQRKCLTKMENIGAQGRTVLFVSHNLSAITALCDKALMLKQGSVGAIGDTKDVVDKYLKQYSKTASQSFYSVELPARTANKADLSEVQVKDGKGSLSSVLLVNEVFTIIIKWRLNVDVPFLRAGVDIIDQIGNVVLSSMDTDTTDMHGKPRSKGLYVEEVTIPRFLLMPGIYTVNVFAGIPRVGRIMEVNNVVGFEILENNTHLSHLTAVKRDGFTAMPLAWTVTHESV